MSAHKALIIEDDPNYAQFVKEALYGLDVVHVDNWHLALLELMRSKYDFIVVDWGCCLHPDRISVDMLRGCAPDATIVVITGSTDRLPEHFDAAEFKIRLARIDDMKTFFYNAIHHRKRIPRTERHVEAVESVSRLFRGVAVAVATIAAVLLSGCATRQDTLIDHLSVSDNFLDNSRP